MKPCRRGDRESIPFGRITEGAVLSNEAPHRTAVASPCGVCGLATEEPVCPRCHTILRPDQAICPKCGKMFRGSIAECDACGAAMSTGPKASPDAEAVREFASVPGISEDRAKQLVARGYHEFSDLVRLALPKSAVAKGLHHAIARRVLLAGIGSREEAEKGTPCPSCGTPWPAAAERCLVCGASPDDALDVESLEERLHAVTGEIVDLTADPDFQEMPSRVKDELLQVFGGVDETELLKEDCRRQIEAWRRKGFDVAPLERLLEEDPRGFQERSVRLIRTQMLKKAEGGRFRCPLCEVALPSVARECPNCGALFE